MSNFTNLTSFTQFLQLSNNMTGGILIFAFVTTVAVVLFLSTVSYGKWKALTYSTFITGILLLLLNVGGLVEYHLIIVDVVLFAIGLFKMMESKSVYG